MGIARRGGNKTFNCMKKLLSVLIVYWSVVGCSINPATGKQDFVLMSEAQEISIGKKYHSQIIQETQPYDNKDLQAYVQRIGDSLAKESHRPNLFYRFTVLDSADINAFALPGGYIYINRGLMSYLSSEEELAAVLGHEIGHVTARHSVRQQSQSQLLGVISAAIEMNSGQSVGQLANIASGALLSGYGREMELEADDLGAQYMHVTGYSAQGMTSVLTVLKDQEVYSKEVAERRGQKATGYHGLFASHPSNDKRLKKILNEVKRTPIIKEKVMTTSYLDKINGMVFGDSEGAGVRRGSEFFHGSLDVYLSSPNDWEIVNTSNNLIFSSPQGKAILRMSLEDLNFRETPQEYMRRISPDFYNGNKMNINNHEAFVALSKRSGKIFRLGVVFREKKVYQFVGYVKDNDYEIDRFDDSFLQIIKSFDNLDVRGRELSKSLRLKKYVTSESDSYKSLATESNIPFDAEQQLRLLNGDYPDKSLIVGKEIKLVE